LYALGSDWPFEVRIYGFLPDMNATTTSGDKLDLPLWQILQDLNFTAMAKTKVRKDRFYAFTNLLYMNLQGTDTTYPHHFGILCWTGCRRPDGSDQKCHGRRLYRD
jgi:hypothetical protein